MAPQDFRKAREQAAVNDDPVVVVTVQGHRYLPKTKISLSKDDTPEKIAYTLGPVLTLLLDQPSIDFTKLTAKHIPGGCTNTLFQVSNIIRACDDDASTDVPDAVLVRLFGGEGMIDRDIDTSTFQQLAEAGLAPPYHGAFVNGRVEGWKIGMRPLSSREMAVPHISSLIAVAMATLHYQFQPLLDSAVANAGTSKEPSLWKQIREWYAQALSNTYQTKYDQERAHALNLHALQDELDWFVEANILPNSSIISFDAEDVVNSTAVVGFCHNDVLAANILYDDDPTSTSIQLIDFEYGGYNYTSFDIANHWNEFAGGPPTTTQPNYDWFPTNAEQRHFIRAYLDHVHKIKPHANKATATMDEEDAVDILLQEVHAFVLINHIYWGLWAVNQAANEGCESYDYLAYAASRFAQYDICKQKFQVESRRMATVDNFPSEHKTA